MANMDIFILFHLLVLQYKLLLAWSLKEKYDYVIVGGGTAGCVLANRLSENPEVSVLLLEAGPDPKQNRLVSTPRTFSDVYTDPDYDWGYVTEPQPYLGSKNELLWEQGKLLGGSGSHNTMVYTRGSPHDYNRWAELGNEGWAYKDVLPYFLKSENMHVHPEYEKYINKDFHGFQGEMQTKISDISGLEEDIIKGGTELGFKNRDLHGLFYENTIGPAQVNIDVNGQRSSTLEAFLRPVMCRSNLDIITEAFVKKVHITKTKISTKADGVFYEKDEITHYVKAKLEVVVSSGALNSPKILMLSGIGPRDHLKAMDIDVFADLPVGNNLENHNAVNVFLETSLSSQSKIEQLFSAKALFEYVFTGKGPWSNSLDTVITFYGSENQPEDDLFPYMEQLFSNNFLTLKNHPKLLKAIKEKSRISSGLFAELLKSNNIVSPLFAAPISLHPKARGTLRLRSNDPFDKPIINYIYLEHEEDMDDCLEGIRMLQRFINTSSFKNAGIHFPSNPDSNCLAYIFDSDEYWRCFVRHNVFIFHHFTSTCKMAPDSSGVVDDQLRVKGIKGLRVVDASIMPQIISGHTHAATVMIAEKASDLIKEHFKQTQLNTILPGCKQQPFYCPLL